MAAERDDQRISVIGLGNMGRALAEALAAQGWKVTAWNRTAHKAEGLHEKGVEIADTAAQAVSSATIVIICVSDHLATKDILFHDELGGLMRGKLLVQLSSISADQSRETADWARSFGIDYLEGSILGLPLHIKENSAIIVYAGQPSLYARHEAVFSALGGNPKFVGETIGAAVTFDKIIYAFGYGLMQSFIQGAALAHAKGVPIQAYTETALARLEVWRNNLARDGESIATRNHDDVQCRIEVHAAAFAGTLALCQETGVDSSLPDAMMLNFERAIAEGQGTRDLSALFEALIPK